MHLLVKIDPLSQAPHGFSVERRRKRKAQWYGESVELNDGPAGVQAEFRRNLVPMSL
jgi:hypothetical protein